METNTTATSNLGLYSKYYVVNRETHREVDNCFVLRPATDPAAMIAMAVYAGAVKDSNPELFQNIMDWLNNITKLHEEISKTASEILAKKERAEKPPKPKKVNWQLWWYPKNVGAQPTLLKEGRKYKKLHVMAVDFMNATYGKGTWSEQSGRFCRDGLPGTPTNDLMIINPETYGSR